MIESEETKEMCYSLKNMTQHEFGENVYNFSPICSSTSLSEYTADQCSGSSNELFSSYENFSSTEIYYNNDLNQIIFDPQFSDEEEEYSFIEDNRATPENYSYSNSRSTPESFKSSMIGEIVLTKNDAMIATKTVKKPSILKSKEHRVKEDEIIIAKKLTQKIVEKVHESEFEDILQHARDIVNPDPRSKKTLSMQPAKVIPNTFRHLLSIKDTFSKTGAFKYRTIHLTRDENNDLGINFRRGDGWETGNGIYVSRIAFGSIFDQYELLTVGDELVMINKVNVKNMNLIDVIRLMHIPRKLLLTMKILTPFSRKRFEKCGIDEKYLKTIGGKYNNKHIVAGSRTNESTYKISQIPIINQHNPIKNNQNDRSIRGRNNNINIKPTKPSPYRTIEGGITVQQLSSKQNLSPIHEDQPSRKSTVRWSDQHYQA